ncbi:hypothetical protein ASU33_09455 [Solirubrum puertoriconensis]|uniref:DUF218 domain-containing protein n=1 Tax=Solirubrum puertoriconensis TaxID=1751427 RepID=A0A9X0HN56_SOLP1|nr:hypothetical protein ASU33_09455 [Solirubrum puertoriconensis]
MDGLDDNPQPADCILILGNTVNPNGTLSARLQARLDKGLELYRQKLAPVVMVSGGLGKEGHYEGRAMAAYLEAAGVPADAIIEDNLGNTTRATAQNFAAVAQRQQLGSVLVVSQFYHITRTKMLLKQQGNHQVYGAHADYFELRDMYSLLREIPAYYRYAFN